LSRTIAWPRTARSSTSVDRIPAAFSLTSLVATSTARSYTRRVHPFLRAALKHPDTSTGIACKGTSLESTTAIVNGKAFLFVGKAARLKRKTGWVKVALDAPLAEVTPWIAESYMLFACPSPGSSAPASRRTTTRSSRPRSSKARTR